MFWLTAAQQQLLTSILKDDFTLSSWIYLGAFLQSILFLLYPYRIVVLPSILALSYRIIATCLMQAGVVQDPLIGKAIQGRTTAQVVNIDGSIPKESSGNQIVVFILGSSSNVAAQGRLRLDGGQEVRKLFSEMWHGLSKNKEKWGFLGRTSTLFASDEPHTNVTTWISYWRSVEDLQAFARSSTHMAALKWWSKRDHPHIGIMHETYVVPAGNWETVYANMRPFGLGTSQQSYTTLTGEKGLTNGLIPIDRSTHSSMKARMGFGNDKPFDTSFYKDEAQLKDAPPT